MGSLLQSLRMRSGTERRFRGDGLAIGKASPHWASVLVKWQTSPHTQTESPASVLLWEAAAPRWYNSVYMGQTIRSSHLHSTDVRQIGLKRTTSLNRPIKHDGGRFMSAKWKWDALKLHLLFAFTIATEQLLHRWSIRESYHPHVHTHKHSWKKCIYQTRRLAKVLESVYWTSTNIKGIVHPKMHSQAIQDIWVCFFSI